MKRLIPLLVLPALFLAGCDSNGAGGAACEQAGLTATGSFSATAAGEGFTAACVSGQFTNGVLAIAGLENIDGSAGASQRQININLFNPQTGSNTIGTGVATYADVDLANPAAGTYASTSGSVQLDAVSATGAKGTFSFTARNNGGQTVQVTNGRFDITF